MIRYVDDFEMSGTLKSLEMTWALLKEDITIGEVEDLRLFLGCMHEQVELTLPDGAKA